MIELAENQTVKFKLKKCLVNNVTEDVKVKPQEKLNGNTGPFMEEFDPSSEAGNLEISTT